MRKKAGRGQGEGLKKGLTGRAESGRAYMTRLKEKWRLVNSEEQ